MPSEHFVNQKVTLTFYSTKYRSAALRLEPATCDLVFQYTLFAHVFDMLQVHSQHVCSALTRESIIWNMDLYYRKDEFSPIRDLNP